MRDSGVSGISSQIRMLALPHACLTYRVCEFFHLPDLQLSLSHAGELVLSH